MIQVDVVLSCAHIVPLIRKLDIILARGDSDVKQPGLAVNRSIRTPPHMQVEIAKTAIIASLLSNPNRAILILDISNRLGCEVAAFRDFWYTCARSLHCV
jgi:hypothetical protein